MAERKNVEQEIIEMPRGHFRHALKCIQRLDPGACKAISEQAAANLNRVNAPRDLTRVEVVNTDSALNVDVGTLVAWMKKVRPDTPGAIKQLQILDATAHARAV